MSSGKSDPLKLRLALGAEIKRRREKNGLTQQQLAAEAGVTSATVSDWEHGKKMPDTLNLYEVARALGTRMTVLLVAAGMESPASLAEGEREATALRAQLEELRDRRADDIPEELATLHRELWPEPAFFQGLSTGRAKRHMERIEAYRDEVADFAKRIREKLREHREKLRQEQEGRRTPG